MSNYFPDEHMQQKTFVNCFESLLGMKCELMMHSENTSSNDGTVAYDFIIMSFGNPTWAVLLF